MKSTFRILFYLKKNEPKKDGTVTIMARITVDGETTIQHEENNSS